MGVALLVLAVIAGIAIGVTVVVLVVRHAFGSAIARGLHW